MENYSNHITFNTGGALSDGLLKQFLSTDEWQEGDIVGSWMIKEVIGRGGMGVVYKAERQDGSYQQTVAIKCLQTINPSKELANRFINERQILATLDHPNIARLLGGGTTEKGHLYLVMEYVDGQDILTFCESSHLSLKQRIILFQQVVDAIEYAHQQLIIHRDIKPSNILVNYEGIVKLLDFGIARLINQDSMDQTALTQAGTTPLTLQYASPEQLLNQKINITSDIYQLGLTFYQLIVNQTVFANTTNPKSLMMDICHTEPLKPSEALKNLHKDLASYKKTWTAKVQGDVDAIISVALRKDPKDRYQSVTQLKDDIKAHTTNHPVNARKGNTWYKLKKTAKRNQATTLLITSFVIIVTILATYSFYAITQQRDKALQESNKAKETVTFLTEILESADPDIARGRNLTVQEVVDDAARRLKTKFDEQPEIKAQLLTTLAQTFAKLGDDKQAEELLTKAHQIHQTQGMKLETIFNGILLLSESHWRRSQYKQANEYLQQAKLLAKEQPILLGRTLSVQADIAMDQGNIQLAEELTQQALPLLINAEDLDYYLDALKTAGFAQRSLGKNEIAEITLRKVLDETIRVKGKNSRLTAEAMTNLANLKSIMGQFDTAEKLLIEARQIAVDILGEIHPNVAKIDISIGVMHYYKGNFEDSLTAWELAKSIYQQIYGPNHRRIADVNNNLGAVLLSLDRYEEAENILQESIQINIALDGPNSNTLSNLYYNLVNTYKSQYKFAQALPATQQLMRLTQIHIDDLSEKSLGRHHVIAARVYRHLGEKETALQLLKQAINHLIQVTDLPKTEMLLALTEVMIINNELNRPIDAQSAEEKAIKFAKSNNLPFHPDPPDLRGSPNVN